MVIVIFINSGLVHVILTIFTAERMGLSCSWKKLLAVLRLVLLLKWNRCRLNKFHCAECLHWHNRVIAIEVEWAWLRRFNAWCNWVLLLSCDNILKFDWHCQLSGSRSNSLNSQKLPGRFSYGLGMRLPHSQALVQGQRKEPGIHCLCTLSSPGDSENLCTLYSITILSHHPLIAIVRARMEVLSQGFDKACIDTAELLHLQAKSHWETLEATQASYLS